MVVKRILIAAAVVSLAGLLLAAPRLTSAWLDKHLRAEGIEFQESPQVHFFPPSVSLSHIRWGGPGPGVQISFSSQTIHLYPHFGELLKGRLIIQELQLDAPFLQVTRLDEAGGDSSRAPSPLPPVERLLCKDGKINLNWDALSVTLDNLRLTAANIRHHEEMDIQSDFMMNLSLHGRSQITTNSALRTKARYYAPNLTVRNMHATFTPTAPACLASLAPLALELSGGFDPSARRGKIKSVSVSLPGGGFSGSGEITQDGFEGTLIVTSNICASYPVEATLKTILKNSEGQLILPDIGINTHGCKGTGTIKIGPRTLAQPVLKGNFRMGPLQAPSLKTIISQNWLRFAEEILSKAPKFHLSANFSQISLDDLVLTSPEIQLSGQGSQLRLEQFVCSLGRGILNLKGLADLAKQQWQIAASGNEIDAGQILNAIGIKGVGQGTATFALQLDIASQGGRFIFPQLEGSGYLQISNLVMDIIGELASITPGLEKLRHKPELIKTGKIGFNAQNGVFSVRPLKFAGPNLSAQGAAQIDLATQALGGHLFLSLDSLKLPLSFSGTLSEPEVSISSQRFQSPLSNSGF